MKEGHPTPTKTTPFERMIERQVGDSIESIREMPIDERRKLVEAKHGSPMRVVSRWPLIGRYEPQVYSGEEVNKLIDDDI